MNGVSIGDLVVVDNDLGIGKVTEVYDDEVVIQYFDSPANFSTHEETVSAQDAQQAYLFQETLVYYYDYDTTHWSLGRVLGPVPEGYRVQFPNEKIFDFKPSELFVRWNRPIEHPVELLAQQMTYTPMWQDARLSFQHEMLKQRQACAGIASVLSSSISLESHQLAAVRRVLSDHKQRYLLADEVGLGKTIEACLIVREHVLDNPASHYVVVLVPPALKQQWLAELSDRFHLGELIGTSIFIITTNELSDLIEHQQKANLLVIDEAHQVGTWAWQPTKEKNYQQIVNLSHHSEKLLLLSATPVVGNEQNFFAMLHLLDPDSYALSTKGLEQFRQNIAWREDLGDAFHAFSTNNTNITLRKLMRQLLQLFPSDEFLQSKSAELTPFLRMGIPTSSPERNTLINLLRHYIGNRYRLHHRMIRTRQSKVAYLLPGLAGLEVKYYQVEQQFEDLLVAWHNHALLYGSDNEIVAQVYLVFVEAALATPGLLGHYASHRLGREVLGEGDFVLNEMQRSALCSPLLYGENELLEELIQHSNASQLSLDENTAILLKELTEKLPDAGIVVFCDQPWVADQIFIHLMSDFAGHIQRHHPEQDLRFGVDPSISILVCDRRAEEGVNLHGKHRVVIHYDLLFCPNRMEQRNGRFNRYHANGHAKAVQSYSLQPEGASGFATQWLELLQEVFQQFERSIASLQYVIDEEMGQVRRDLFAQGEESLFTLRSRLAGTDGRLEQELRKIESQEVLLEIDQDVMEAQSYVDELQKIDEKESNFAVIAGDWIKKVLNFRINHDDTPEMFSYAYDVGERKTGTMISLEQLSEHCLLGFRRDIAQSAPTTHSMSYIREVAEKGKVRVARLGEPFHDAIMTLMSYEERGIASASIRVINALPDDAFLPYFRYDFLVTAGQSQEGEEAAARRTKDYLLTPRTFSVWLNESLEIVKNPALIEMLERPYHKIQNEGTDLNLTDRWPLVNTVIDTGTWADLARSAHEVTADYVAEMFKESHLEGIARVEKYLATRALEKGHDDKFAQEIRDSIESPRYRCIATKAMILTSRVKLKTLLVQHPGVSL